MRKLLWKASSINAVKTIVSNEVNSLEGGKGFLDKYEYAELLESTTDNQEVTSLGLKWREMVKMLVNEVHHKADKIVANHIAI